MILVYGLFAQGQERSQALDLIKRALSLPFQADLASKAKVSNDFGASPVMRWTSSVSLASDPLAICVSNEAKKPA